jgi:hypothetical protein
MILRLQLCGNGLGKVLSCFSIILIYNDSLLWPNTNLDDAVCRPMALPITASRDTAWNRTRVCSDASSTEMQCLRPLSPKMPMCTEQGPYRNGLSRSVWKNLTGLHRALTSTLSDTFGMNRNTDCKPGLIVKHQCPTSLMLLWLNGSKSLQQCSNIYWKAFIEEWNLLKQQRGTIFIT